MNSETIDNLKPSIIIAAYNEAKVITETLMTLSDKLRANQYPVRYQIIVVCNGCTDGTENIVRDEFPNAHCFSLPEPSKALAIRHAESLNPGFPRIYLDADIVLTKNDADRLLSLMSQHDEPRLLIPSSNLMVTKSTAMVRSFYRRWYNTPHVQRSGYGAGTYVINKAGRDRFDQWPDLIADDAFIRSRFKSSEIEILKDAKVQVKAPKTLWSLIKVKSRSKLGNLELRRYLDINGDIKVSGERQPPLIHKDKTSTHKPTHKTMKDQVYHETWYDKPVYLAVNLIAMAIAKYQHLTGYKSWQRDDSNR